VYRRVVDSPVAPPTKLGALMEHAVLPLERPHRRGGAPVRALGAITVALLVTILVWNAFANLYWATRGGSLFEVWPLMVFAAVVLVMAMSVGLYRYVGPGRARLTRRSGIVLALSSGLVVAIGVCIMLRPAIEA